MLEALNSAARCVTSQRLNLSTDAIAPNYLHAVSFAAPVSLRAPEGGPSGLMLDIALVFTIVETERIRLRQEFGVSTRMYEYRLLDRHQTELLVYHWQPGPDFAGPDHPHLHISASLDAQITAQTRREINLDKLHVATDYISPVAIIRMLVSEFKVTPLRHDWREILDRSETGFQVTM